MDNSKARVALKACESQMIECFEALRTNTSKDKPSACDALVECVGPKLCPSSSRIYLLYKNLLKNDDFKFEDLKQKQTFFSITEELNACLAGYLEPMYNEYVALKELKKK